MAVFLQLAGSELHRTLALQQWRGVPASVHQRRGVDLKGREWPPAALDAPPRS